MTKRLSPLTLLELGGRFMRMLYTEARHNNRYWPNEQDLESVFNYFKTAFVQDWFLRHSSQIKRVDIPPSPPHWN